MNLDKLTKDEILKLYKGRCKHGHRFLSHPNCYLKEKNIKKRIGYIDIEASNLKANFGIILCWCIKDSNKNKIYEDVLTKADLTRGKLDWRIVNSCIKTMKQFDVLVGHYSKRFDIPFIRTRAIMLDISFPEYGAIEHIDTYDIAKRVLCLHSNRQNVIAEALHGETEKTRIDSKRWIAALQGDNRALNYILEHCRRDVRDLERNHKKLEKFVKISRRSI